MDPEYPGERLSFMVEDAGSITPHHHQGPDGLRPDEGSPLILLDADRESIAAEPMTTPAHTTSPNHIAYCIYTSGSTGKPKGVLVPHQGLLNLVFWHQGAFEITSSDRATQLAGTAFDASVWKIWPYLSKGQVFA